MANATALKSASLHPTPPPPAAEDRALFAFSHAMLTDQGRVRHANQDACAAAPEHAAFVVCDGVGGAAGGEIASQLAAETFLAALRSSANQNDPRVPHSSHEGSRSMSGIEDSSSNPHARLHRAVTAANATVFQRAQKSRALHGMATTLVAALLEYPEAGSNKNVRVPHPYAGESTRMGGRNTDRTENNGSPAACPTLWLAHAGDSRAYRLRSAELTQLTTDHSLVEEQVRAGLLSPADAARSPVRNVITRAVGAQHTVEPEIGSHEIRPGDLFLLASDGLTRELTDAEIARIMIASLDRVPHSSAAASSTSGKQSLELAARALIDAANRHGGRDNITVLLLACR